ncbi:MAG TPA: hypothetical protein VLU92_11340 [Candidatus Dormibacteraeota bacterium]|nr:hypothetical protein [Candidatus Dormibacteraeota bacterium]
MTMKLVTVAQMTVRVSGIALLILGVIFWTGNLDSLHLLHILLGLLLVLGLWTLALIAIRAQVAVGIAVLALAWGVIAPALGLTQVNLLPGGWHWVIQVLHLLVGVGAIGIAEALGAGIKRSGRAAAPGSRAA